MVVLRSAWAITEASRALPKDEELAVAARSASQRMKPAADAALAASIFHYGQYSIAQVKEYLRQNGVPVRT